MADTSGLVTFKYIVASFKNDLDIDDREDERLLQWTIDSYSEINLSNHTKHAKSAWLPVDYTTKSVVLPKDFIDYLAIGVPMNGRLWTMTRDAGIIQTRSEDTCEATMNADRGEGSDISKFIDWHYCSEASNDAGYFDVDYHARRILVSNTSATEILVVYKSSGISLDAETFVPRMALLCIKAYMKWMLSEKNRESMSERNVNESRYEYEKKRLSRMMGAMTKDELLDVIASGYSQGAKR